MLTNQAALWVRVLVFPEPAPARIRSGLPQCTTATCCRGFKSDTIEESITMGKLYHGAGNFLFPLGIFVFVLAIFLSPIFKYLPATIDLGKGFLFGSTKELRSQDNRTNVLILGLGGPKNEPSGLTDTIIFFSIDHANKNSLLLSLPRDIWIPQMRAKLNTAYYYGNRSEGLGMEWTKGFISEILGQPIHYTVVVSFDGFVKTIDLLGGVSINVEKGFTDARYPIPGKEDDPCGDDPETLCRYETVSFSEGRQYLDGKTALKFARSRHAEGEEGTDFARSARQQKVALAIKNKVLSPRFLLNPFKVSQMVDLVTNSLETDVPQSHLGPLVRLFLNLDKAKIRSEVLSESTSEDKKLGLLVNPPIAEYDGQWVFVPRDGTWGEAKAWVKNLLD